MIAEKKYEAITSWLENGNISFWYNIFSVCNCFLTFLCDENKSSFRMMVHIFYSKISGIPEACVGPLQKEQLFAVMQYEINT